MTDVGQVDRKTQQRVVRLFREQLEYLIVHELVIYWRDATTIGSRS